MKPLIPILIVATTSLAVASVQFGQQASTQRKRADAEMALRQKQEARVAQLERSQARLEQELMVARGAAGAPPPPPAEGIGAPPVAAARAGAQSAREHQVFSIQQADRVGPGAVAFGAARPRPFMESAAGRNFMKTRVKSSLRRMYDDVGPALGLSPEKTNELIDLLADQQTRNFGPPPEGQNRMQYARDMQQKNNAEIAALVGQDKVDEWAAYQKSLPERSQLNQVREQLEAAGVPMTDSQRTELLAAISEETQRSPRPSYTAGLPQEELMAQMNQWQAEYDKALLDRAKQVLNSDQFKAYKEYQDWQTEMRSSLPPGARGAVRLGVSGAPGLAVESSYAAPVIMPAPMPPADRR